jgi:hypothetical protein
MSACPPATRARGRSAKAALFSLQVDPKQLMRHPFGSREMTIEHKTRAFSILIRIEVQYDPCNVAPVGTFLRVIQDAEIGVDVFFVIGRDYRTHRGNVGQFRSHARLGMGSLGEKLRKVSSNGTQYLHNSTRPTLHNEKAPTSFSTVESYDFNVTED